MPTCCLGNAFFARAFFRTSRLNFLRSRLDFSLELLTDRVGLSGLFVVGRNPFIDVNIAIRTLFTPFADVSFSCYWLSPCLAK